MKKQCIKLVVVLVAAILVASMNYSSMAQDEGSSAKPKCCPLAGSAPKECTLKPQESCPIMGGKINKKEYVDVSGHRIYVCCPGCKAKIKEDPGKAIAALVAKGEKPEVRLAVCAKCGEIKGAKACCNVDAMKCSKCNLAKGSPGCCKNLKPVKGEKEVLLCPKCGEQKGTENCCKVDAAKCAKCGLNKGAPGCCKINKIIKACWAAGAASTASAAGATCGAGGACCGAAVTS